jgi:hypothetical protein
MGCVLIALFFTCHKNSYCPKYYSMRSIFYFFEVWLQIMIFLVGNEKEDQSCQNQHNYNIEMIFF